MVELSNWTLENGPVANSLGDLWARIDEDLGKPDIPAAAARLRRGSEEYFCSICNSLGAPVRFKESGQYELGDLLPPSMGIYKKYLKEAKEAARSWGNDEKFQQLNQLDKYAGQVYVRSKAENWAVNSNVHYNKWTDFTLNDFKPVVETFDELF